MYVQRRKLCPYINPARSSRDRQGKHLYKGEVIPTPYTKRTALIRTYPPINKKNRHRKTLKPSPDSFERLLTFLEENMEIQIL